MPAKNPLASSVQPIRPRLGAADRRAAQIAAASTRQAELKLEAAQRRHARELRNDPPKTPKPNSYARRSHTP